MAILDLSTRLAIRDELSLEAWMAFGAFLQALLTLFVPLPFALAPATLFVTWRVTIFLLMTFKILHDPSFDRVKIGRHTTQLPDDKGNFSKAGAENEVVIFILGARSNHLQGRFAPGYAKLRDLFNDMVKDLEKKAETSGCLGITPPMLSLDHETANTITWVTYWKDIESLHAWAHSDAHVPAMIWWPQEERKHLGIMHETYIVPKNSWETIYYNYEPFGMGQGKAIVHPDEGVTKAIDLLRETKGTAWKSMLSRMNRREIAIKRD